MAEDKKKKKITVKESPMWTQQAKDLTNMYYSKGTDGTIKLIKIEELKEALALSILEVGRLIKGE